jgi:uncharacterized protein (TIGR03546 family)
MIIFTIKLLSNLRKAIAGRKHPHQLAWAVAFGVLLGIVPHGNLLALAILIVVLSLRVNHAMAGVAAIASAFLASSRLDPLADQVGHFVLTHETAGPLVARAWQLPLVPWTDLNNTVVMGSCLLGLAALIPIFLLTYPIFRLFAPAPESIDDDPGAATAARSGELVLVDKAHDRVSPPTRNEPVAAPVLAANTTRIETPSTESVDRYLASIDADSPVATAAEGDDETANRISVETRIDVIRMKDYRDVSGAAASSDQTSASGDAEAEQPLDEALNYLLRQLRDSQQRKAG